jgi:hypothetical protein
MDKHGPGHPVVELWDEQGLKTDPGSIEENEK